MSGIFGGGKKKKDDEAERMRREQEERERLAKLDVSERNRRARSILSGLGAQGDQRSVGSPTLLGG